MLRRVLRHALRLAMDGLWAAELLDGASYLRHRFRIRACRIVEAGCRFGEDSLLLAANYPNAELLSFECNPETLMTTRKNIEKMRSIRLMETALDSSDGEVTFYAAAQLGNPGASSMLKVLPGREHAAWLRAEDIVEITVQARQLDSVLREVGWTKIDILWMDVEGAELRVLEGAKGYLPTVELVYTEVSLARTREGQASFDDIRAMLESNGLREVRPWLRRTKRLLGSATANVIFARVPGDSEHDTRASRRA